MDDFLGRPSTLEDHLSLTPAPLGGSLIRGYQLCMHRAGLVEERNHSPAGRWSTSTSSRAMMLAERGFCRMAAISHDLAMPSDGDDPRWLAHHHLPVHAPFQ